MIRALFLDFYGTVAQEDDAQVAEICRRVAQAAGLDAQRVELLWRDRLRRACAGAHGEAFVRQRAIERDTLAELAACLGICVDADELCAPVFAHWMKPPLHNEARALFASCPVPIYIVSNIDRADVKAALDWNGLKPAGVFTSEDARAYKPRPELFRLALRETGRAGGEVLHVGDSLGSDVEGARGAGIGALWLNRRGAAVPRGIASIDSLTSTCTFLTDSQ